MSNSTIQNINIDTFELKVPRKDITIFKEMVKRMGWTIAKKEKPQLYSPESGDYLNDKTMKVIENARKGKDIEFIGDFDDFKQMANSL